MNKSFERFYGKEIFGYTENFYGISKKNTKTSYHNYIQFLKRNNLKFKYIKNNYFSKKIEGSILSNEKNLNFFKIKTIIKKKLNLSKIKVNYSKNINIENFDKVIVCCYDQNNVVLNQYFEKKKLRKYKFELVEKIVISLPKEYRYKSFMVLDGKFVSLDPYLGTPYHLLSDVKYSKIEISKSFFPTFKDKRKLLINKGLIKDIKLSEFYNFIDNSSNFLPFLKSAKYVGSFFVVRALELDKEKTDERLNTIQKHDDKFYSVFSGKWNTCVGMANKMIEIIK